MRVIRELRARHRLLAQQVSDLLRIVRGTVPDAAAVAVLRWQIAPVLLDYCAREDAAICEPLMASGDIYATAAVWQHQCAHGGVPGEFRRFIERWPVARIAREWEAFRLDTETVVVRLMRRIERGEAVLYLHAERVMAPAAPGEHIGRPVRAGDACAAVG
jgi:hypothetical protein